ncbi:hypothetical protein DVA86_30610 [Streptomyces armeniacus]|uniref:Uncharacterized protein n=1 Tax=Streptomyces armeniacus TaxID=83291 RepID=A0A345XXC6_9ACTN|nr:hypothetical protein DVA86_30610 [Streptomyces armeniacus]
MLSTRPRTSSASTREPMLSERKKITAGTRSHRVSTSTSGGISPRSCAREKAFIMVWRREAM